MNDEFRFEAWAEKACDQIDAGIFSGDTFHSREAIARLREFLTRWGRGLDDAECIVLNEDI